MQTIVTNCTKNLADLLPLMPRGVDLVWHRGLVPPQYDVAGTRLPKTVLHFALPLDGYRLIARKAASRSADGHARQATLPPLSRASTA
jgi:hypothetical protein